MSLLVAMVQQFWLGACCRWIFKVLWFWKTKSMQGHFGDLSIRLIDNYSGAEMSMVTLCFALCAGGKTQCSGISQKCSMWYWWYWNTYLEAECQFHCKATIFILIISDWAIKMCFWLRTETCRFKGFVLVWFFYFWTGIRKNISAVLFNNKCRSNISVEVIGKIVLYFVADKYKYLVIKHSDNI